MRKPLTVWITINCGKFWKRWEYQTTSPASWETPVLWSPHWKSWLIGKDPDAGRDWGQEEKGTTEDEMAGLHHQLDGHEFEWTPGVGDGQGGLACCRSWGCKSRTRLSDWTDWTKWTVKRINLPLMWLVSTSQAVVFNTDYTLESLGEHLKILISRPHLWPIKSEALRVGYRNKYIL